jgi:hypothetical protein
VIGLPFWNKLRTRDGCSAGVIKIAKAGGFNEGVREENLMNSRVRHFASNTLILLLSLCTACTTMRPVMVDAAGSQIRSQVHAGDTVRVLTRDSLTETIQVTALGDTALVGTAAGARVEVPYQSIQRLEVRQVSSAKTTWLIIGAVAVIGLGAAAAEAGHHPCTGGYCP